MGVPYLAHYYHQKYNKQNELNIDIDKLSGKCDNLFFDYNSLIHPCAQQILSANKDIYLKLTELTELTNLIEKDIIKNCLTYTKLIMNKVSAKYVYITIDGVAPRAKIQQQRERRYKSEFFKLNETTEGVVGDTSPAWDSNKITPGTNFMNKLALNLLEFKEDVKEDFNVFISDANEPGEGEHKIMKIINTLPLTSSSCIYGLDGDLMFLSLLKPHSIILIRDNTFNSRLDDLDIKKCIDYLNITNLKKYIANHISDQLKLKGITDFNKENLIFDYVLMCFMLGNDFLEHLPSLCIKKGGIDTIIKVYTNSWKGKHLVNLSAFSKSKIYAEPEAPKSKNSNSFKNCINLIFLKDIFYQLRNHESYFFKNFRYEELMASEVITLEKIAVQNENVKFYNSNIIYQGELEDIKKKYYLYYCINLKHEACFNYIEGLYWILAYYYDHTNTHNNWNWYYRYNNSLFCSDLFEYLRTNNLTLLQENINKTETLNSSNVFSSIKQLCMVLPKSSLMSVLKELNYPKLKLLELTMLKYDIYFPDNIFVDTVNKKYLWQSKVFFKNLERDDNIFDLF